MCAVSAIPSQDLAAEIRRLKRERNAVVLAHYYQESEIQDLADFVGDLVVDFPSRTGQLEYAHDVGGSKLLAGLAATADTMDTAYRPYVGWQDRGTRALLAGEVRHSNNGFFPNSSGIGVELKPSYYRQAQRNLAAASAEGYAEALGQGELLEPEADFDAPDALEA